MGTYLMKPETEKFSSDKENDKLKYGASSMQGWRESQEDAHNCILDFDENTSLFAVYDGHGGCEVAQYCSLKLPNFIKQTEAYKAGNIEKALEDTFLGIDATIVTEEVVRELNVIASEKDLSQDRSDEEENVDHLYEEAEMPLDKVLEKYKNKLLHSNVINQPKDSEKLPSSSSSQAACSSSSSSSTSHSKDTVSEVQSSTSSANEAVSLKYTDNKAADTSSASEENIKLPVPDCSDNKEAITSTKSEAECKSGGEHVNGDVTSEELNKSDVSSSSGENGDVSKKGKGKAIAKTKGAQPPSPVKERSTRNAKQLYKDLISKQLEEESSSSDDDEDKTFEGPEESSDDDDEEGVNIAIEDENSEDSQEDEEEDEDEEDDDDEEGYVCPPFARNMERGPGLDSGTTAVVALLKRNELYVANAGDSRCVVCRNGKAVEMSFDHKPEDQPELDRITKAGGEVRYGRVDGGLNLSRAIGDHAYKQNKNLSDREQTITALPDVRTLTINPAQDEFMILACDGIWNYMSSQDVVDFVRPKLQDGVEKLSQICEEMFDHCLAPSTLGDGTGCDNMTAIIVQFKPNILKRASSTEPEAKRAKTEDESAPTSTAPTSSGDVPA